MSGRAATRRSQASSTSVTCAAVDATAATPISARRCRSMLPVSATATHAAEVATACERLVAARPDIELLSARFRLMSEEE